jgi:hypothetical protein
VPPRGTPAGSKRARQYQHICESERARGVGEERAEEIAARTVNKARARAGDSTRASKLSLEDISSQRRGGLRSGTRPARGRTYRQLYGEARALGIGGRSRMPKAELDQAVESAKHR